MDTPNSSGWDSTTVLSKNVFKKPATLSLDFDTLNESSPKVHFDNDFESITDIKKNAFVKKTQEINQDRFNVEYGESDSECGSENSVSLIKSRPLFEPNKKHVQIDQFHVSLNETRTNINFKESPNEPNASIDVPVNATLSKFNKFKRKQDNTSQNDFNVDFDATDNDGINITLSSFKKPRENSERFQVSLNETSSRPVKTDGFANKTSEDEENQNSIASKSNPFKNVANKQQKEAFTVDFDESTFNDNSELISERKPIFKKSIQTLNNFDISYNNLTSERTKSIRFSINRENIEKKKNEEIIEDTGHLKSLLIQKESLTIESSISPKDNNETRMSALSNTNEITAIDKTEKGMNWSLSKEASKLTNRSSILDELSYNDENLNNWVSSGSSDDEFQHLSIPPVVINNTTKKIPQAQEKGPPKETVKSFIWDKKAQEIIAQAKRCPNNQDQNLQTIKTKKKESNINKKKLQVESCKAPKLKKPAAFASKRLYQYVINKMEPKFGIDSVMKAEELVSYLCDVVKKVTRRNIHQKKLIQELKKEMAAAGVIETTVDFYEFVIKFLPYNFRVKVIPCIQPVTNVVFPPRDTVNPFDKIL